MMLKVCTEKEAKKYFSDCVAGGITFNNVIKIFMESGNFEDESACIAQILSHEILHQVLGKTIGLEAKVKLDNIHKRVYVFDPKHVKLTVMVLFVLGKKGEKKVVFC